MPLPMFLSAAKPATTAKSLGAFVDRPIEEAPRGFQAVKKEEEERSEEKEAPEQRMRLKAKETADIAIEIPATKEVLEAPEQRMRLKANWLETTDKHAIAIEIPGVDKSKLTLQTLGDKEEERSEEKAAKANFLETADKHTIAIEIPAPEQRMRLKANWLETADKHTIAIEIPATKEEVLEEISEERSEEKATPKQRMRLKANWLETADKHTIAIEIPAPEQRMRLKANWLETTDKHTIAIEIPGEEEPTNNQRWRVFSLPLKLELSPGMSAISAITTLLEHRARGKSVDCIWNTKGSQVTNEGIVAIHDKVSCPEGHYKNVKCAFLMDNLKDVTNLLVKNASRLPERGRERMNAFFHAAATFAVKFYEIAPFLQGNFETIEAVVANIMALEIGFNMTILEKEGMTELLKGGQVEEVFAFLASTAAMDENPEATGGAIRSLERSLRLLDHHLYEEANTEITKALRLQPSARYWVQELYKARYRALMGMNEPDLAEAALAKALKYTM